MKPNTPSRLLPSIPCFIRIHAARLLLLLLALAQAPGSAADTTSDEGDAPDLSVIAQSVVDTAAYKLAAWHRFQHKCGLPAQPSRSRAGRAFLALLEHDQAGVSTSKLHACTQKLLPTGKDLTMPGETLIDWGRSAGLQIEMKATPWFPPAERDRLLRAGSAARGMGIHIVNTGETSRAVFFMLTAQKTP